MEPTPSPSTAIATTDVQVVPALPALAVPACRNCGAALGHPRPNYCGECGQETALKPPTVMEFMHQFGGSYVAMEGALWRTLLLLLLRPGRLTREYLAGRKRRYVLPLRLYLTISLATLLAFQWTGALRPPPDKQVFRFDSPSEANNAMLSVGEQIKAGMQNGKFVCQGLPAAWCDRLRERFTLDAPAMERELRRVPERFVSHWGSAMFALLPLYAFFLKLVYVNRRMRWSEHLVFALHLHAFLFAMALVQLVPWQWVRSLALLAMPVYSVIALQVVYGGRWWATTLRAATLGFSYFVTLAVAMAIVAVWAFIA